MVSLGKLLNFYKPPISNPENESTKASLLCMALEYFRANIWTSTEHSTWHRAEAGHINKSDVSAQKRQQLKQGKMALT